MKILAWSLVAGVSAVILAQWLHKKNIDRVSKTWRTDHERRTWGEGMDGVSWTWPRVWNGATWVARNLKSRSTE